MDLVTLESLRITKGILLQEFLCQELVELILTFIISVVAFSTNISGE